MRRILPILSIILLIAFQSQGQSSRPTTPPDGADRIIKLYPNPAVSYITFDLQKKYQKNLTVHVYNGLLGKRMYEAQNIPEKFIIDVNEFNRGIYFYQLIDLTGKIIESGKFQVSR